MLDEDCKSSFCSNNQPVHMSYVVHGITGLEVNLNRSIEVEIRGK